MVDDELLRVITVATRHDVTFASPPERLSGGFWAAIYAFQLTAQDGLDSRWSSPLVLRVMPEAAVAAKEIIVQRVLADTGFPTPAVVLHGNDDPLGGAFMIMARAAGQPPMKGLDLGKSIPNLVRTLRNLPVLLAETAVRLHATDPAPIAAALQAGGIRLSHSGDTSYKVDIVLATKTPARGFTELLQWFDDNEPDTSHRVVCHGDLHPFNLMVADDENVTVLDWTNANICPPELDVGFTSAFLRCAPIGVPAVARPVVRLVTNGLARRFLASYREQPGAPVLDESRRRWYEALQYARCLAEVAIGRTDPTAVVGPDHPFETSATEMQRVLRRLTGITVELPDRAPV